MTHLQAIIRRLVRASIARRCAAAGWQHTNSDGVHTPAEWGVDTWGDQAHRHTLATGLTAALDEGSGELTLVLTYDVQPLTCPETCPRA